MTSRIKSLRNVEIGKDIDADLMIVARPSDMRGGHLTSHVGQAIGRCWRLGEDSGNLPIHGMENSGALKNDNGEVDLPIHAFEANFHEWLLSSSKEVPHVFIDISCMSRPLMAEVFSVFFKEALAKTFAITVGYVIAAFKPPPENLPPNEDIRPISEAFAGWPSYPAASTSLIVGLGYEREKAEGACEYFDSNEAHLFIPSSPISQYDQAVEANNKLLVARAERQQHAYTYKVDNAEQTFGQLAMVASDLVTYSNPVILPFGPKIFFVLSLIVAEIYKEIGVWYVTGDHSPVGQTFEPSDHIIGFRMELGLTTS